MNDVTLREYIEALMAEREKRTTQLERDAKDALNKASIALEKRLDLLNEFRAQSADELAPMKAQLATVNAEVAALTIQLVAMKERVDIAQGGRSMLVSVISIMLAVAAIGVSLLR